MNNIAMQALRLSCISKPQGSLAFSGRPGLLSKHVSNLLGGSQTATNGLFPG